MSMQDWLWAGAAGSLALAIASGAADWLRGRRRELDQAGFVPWRGLQVAAMFVALGFAIFAMRG